MAIGGDEYGGLDGLVTLEALVEQNVGEIDAEHDVAAGGMLIQRADGVLEALGRCPIDDLEERLGRSLLDPEEDSDVDTVGGLIVSHLGRVPLRGELIEHPGGLTFEVLEADPRRVKRVRIRQPVPHSSADAA
jgi:CBS domain containing-hemolysin-like protein